MERALNKIADIISDMSWRIDSNDEAMAFLRGYLIALMEDKEITRDEYITLLRFFNNLIKDKKIIAK
ncbi:MAG: hypothetical protein ACOCM4_11070 [Acetivibrio ethanolgignens]